MKYLSLYIFGFVFILYIIINYIGDYRFHKSSLSLFYSIENEFLVNKKEEEKEVQEQNNKVDPVDIKEKQKEKEEREEEKRKQKEKEEKKEENKRLVKKQKEEAERKEGQKLVIQMKDKYGDGWNGYQYQITSQTNQEIVANGTIENGYSKSDSYNLPTGCYVIAFKKGKYPSEISFTLSINDEIIMMDAAVGTYQFPIKELSEDYQYYKSCTYDIGIWSGSTFTLYKAQKNVTEGGYWSHYYHKGVFCSELAQEYKTWRQNDYKAQGLYTIDVKKDDFNEDKVLILSKNLKDLYSENSLYIKNIYVNPYKEFELGQDTWRDACGPMPEIPNKTLKMTQPNFKSSKEYRLYKRQLKNWNKCRSFKTDIEKRLYFYHYYIGTEGSAIFNLSPCSKCVD